VYGPFGRTFTITPVEFLRLGIPLVADGYPGRANLIYVDNLVDLIVAALERPPTASRVYVASEPEPAAWETLYAAYARTIGVTLMRFVPAESPLQLFREEIAVSASNARRLVGQVVSDMKAPLLRGLATYHRHVPLLQRVDRLVEMRGLRKAAAAARTESGVEPQAAADAPQSGLRGFAPADLREFYGARATFSAEKAARDLGWSPRVTPSEAIDRTCDWITFAGI
jgi:nucleoside-diphosphate-sugar epimerase